MYKLKDSEAKVLHKYLQDSTYSYSIVSVENNGHYTMAEIQEFKTDGKTIENEYILYISNGRIENADGDILCGIYGAYSQNSDITFVMMNFYRDNEIESTEVVGFVHGNEVKNMELLLEQIGELRTESNAIF